MSGSRNYSRGAARWMLISICRPPWSACTGRGGTTPFTVRLRAGPGDRCAPACTTGRRLNRQHSANPLHSLLPEYYAAFLEAFRIDGHRVGAPRCARRSSDRSDAYSGGSSDSPTLGCRH
jgi:hypothetical protein